MVTIHPIRHALVPVDSDAAGRLCSPNYDEFQNDREIYDFVEAQPESVLRVTMPHVNAACPEEILPDGSPEALALARVEMEELKASASTRVASITGPSTPRMRATSSSPALSSPFDSSSLTTRSPAASPPGRGWRAGWSRRRSAAGTLRR